MNQSDIAHFEKTIASKLAELLSEGKALKSSMKEDKSLVTEVDLFVCSMMKEHYKKTAYNFFSEEDFDQLKFPSVILDPIDGTKELNSGIGECAVSLAIMNSSELSDAKNQAWIYNPFTGFSLSTFNSFVLPSNFYQDNLQTLVSRTEWSKGKFTASEKEKFHVVPRGSVAFKLALLAGGACDFLISKEAKSVWDIAAGGVLCHQRGFNFYEKGILITKLDKQRYQPPLIWCREKDFGHISKNFA